MAAPNPVRVRRQRLRLLVVVAVVVSVAAIAATYLLFFTGDSPPPLSLSSPSSTVAGGSASTTTADAGVAPVTTLPPPTAEAQPSPGLEGAWGVGSGSTAGYRVREKLARLPAQSDAVGRTSSIIGTIQVSREGGDTAVAEGARFEVDLSTLRSDESQRDNRIRTLGLESQRFPTATFVSTAPIRLPASAESGQAVKVQANGDLTIHGVTKPVTIPLDAQLTGGRIEVVGRLTFPFSDFGMSPPNIAGVVTVENDATLEFQLFFDKR